MHNDFSDITEKLGTPKWFDVKGFPRYNDFRPNETSNIYASIVFLVEIACQDCHHKMDVSVDFSDWELYVENKKLMERWKELAKEKGIAEGKLVFRKYLKDFFLKFTQEELCKILHYGDPPRHDCPGAGETMNCYDLKVKECWIKEDWDFVRCPELEKELEQIPPIEI